MRPTAASVCALSKRLASSPQAAPPRPRNTHHLDGCAQRPTRATGRHLSCCPLQYCSSSPQRSHGWSLQSQGSLACTTEPLSTAPTKR